MAHAKLGWTWPVMATVSTGEIVVILEFPRERPAREFRRQLDQHYRLHPRKFLNIHYEYMEEARAAMYRHILDEPSSSPRTAPVKNVADPARAESPPLVRLYQRIMGYLSRLIGLSPSARESASPVTQMGTECRYWIGEEPLDKGDWMSTSRHTKRR